jgi:hypothetical protein
VTAIAMTEDQPAEAAAVYLLPTVDDDARFTFGLVLDVADVLVAHRYPAPAAGLDWVELQQDLFQFLYRPRQA